MHYRRMTGDQERGVTAQTILTIRLLRKAMFPSEIFDEFAWNMLLVLFVELAANEVVTEAKLIARADVSLHAGRRWISHLIKDGQIADRQDEDDVILTPRAISQLRDFLDQARVIGEHSLLPAA